MESKNVTWYLTLFLLLTGISFLSYSDIPTKLATESPYLYFNESEITSESHNYTTHDPIIVIGDDNFTPNGFSGDGTWQSPYVIENLNITSLDVPAMQFVNVTRPFEIRSCLLTSPMYDMSSVVSFENASNWLVYNSTISGSENGLYFTESSNIRIMGNTISGQSRDSLRGHFSRNVTIANNVVRQSEEGLMLTYSNDMNVTDNLFSQLQLGIYARWVINGTIESNVFEKSSDGVCDSASKLYTQNNSFIDITGYALIRTGWNLLGYSSPNPSKFPLELRSYAEFNTFENCSVAFGAGWGGSLLFANNTILDCDVGVQLEYSTGNQIIGNIIRNSRTYNLWLEHTDLNQIHSNTITGAGVKNALDDDGLNYWDDRTSQGNSWDDHIGPDEYGISGTSDSVDHWPRRYGPPYLSVVNETEIAFSSTGVNVTWSAFDSDPSTYTIYINGTEMLSEIWNGGNVTLSLDDFEVGTYNLTAVVTDELGHSSSATVFVTITPFPFAEFLIISGATAIIIVSGTIVWKQVKKRQDV